MKKALLHYVAGLCQAASAALMASAVIMPDVRVESVQGCAIAALIGCHYQGDTKMSAIWLYLLGLFVAVLIIGFCIPDKTTRQN